MSLIQISKHVSLFTLAALVGLSGLSAGCSDDDTKAGSGGSGGATGGTGGIGAAGAGGTCAGSDAGGCTQVVAPGANDTEALQSALIDVKSGGTVCLCPGSYSLTKEVSLNVTGVTVKGLVPRP